MLDSEEHRMLVLVATQYKNTQELDGKTSQTVNINDNPGETISWPKDDNTLNYENIFDDPLPSILTLKYLPAFHLCMK
jgi:hypothetical protein